MEQTGADEQLTLRGKRRWWIIPSVLIGFAIWDSWTDINSGEAGWQEYFLLPMLPIFFAVFSTGVRTLKVWLSSEGIRYRWYVGTKAVPIFTMDYAVPWSCFYSAERLGYLKWLDIPPRVVLLHGQLGGRGVLVSLSTLATDFGEALAFMARHVDPEIISPEVLELMERDR